MKFTIFGSLIVGAAHFTWPGFRKQTLALKGFLVSSGMYHRRLWASKAGIGAHEPASIFGLVIGADNHLLKYEAEFRKSENAQRRKAINALAMEGRVASEMEIKTWRETHGDRQAPAAVPTSAAGVSAGDQTTGRTD